VLVVASSSGVRVSRDAGVHWESPAGPPEGAPIVVYGAPFEAPVVVTTDGVFTTSDGKRFGAVPGGLRPVQTVELLADRNGDPLLEVRSGGVLGYWDGRAWSTRKKATLSGGIFLKETSQTLSGGYTNLQDVGGTLLWQEGRSRRAFTSPRAALMLASAAEGAGGRVYVGTMGDGLFLFEP
jgi:hypothetical protein